MGSPVKPVRGAAVQEKKSPAAHLEPRKIFAQVHARLSALDYDGEHAISDFYVAEQTVYGGRDEGLHGRKRVGDMIPLAAFFGSVPAARKARDTYGKEQAVAAFFEKAGWDVVEDHDGNSYVVGVPHEEAFVTVAEFTEIRANEAEALPPKKMTAGTDDAKALEQAAKRFKKKAE